MATVSKYCKLEAAKGFLEGHSTLDVSMQEHAESQVEELLNRELAAWDKSHWTPEAAPKAVRLLALKVGSAHYLVMTQAQGSAEVDPPFPKRLLREAMEVLTQWKAQGWIPGDVDGDRIYARNRSSAMFPERVR